MGKDRNFAAHADKVVLTEATLTEIPETKSVTVCREGGME